MACFYTSWHIKKGAAMSIMINEGELSKSVKQSSTGRFAQTKTKANNKWQRVDLNRRPRARSRGM